MEVLLTLVALMELMIFNENLSYFLNCLMELEPLPQSPPLIMTAESSRNDVVRAYQIKQNATKTNEYIPR